MKVCEIFYSLQGEALHTGRPTVFVRLSGCPLRCSYCDTEYAFHGGLKMSISQIAEKVESYGVPLVTVTGGEPLAQKQCISLLQQLLQRCCERSSPLTEVSLETSGALSIAEVPSKVQIVLDVKTPGSGEARRNLESNFAQLKAGDQTKFVIVDREDYDWSTALLAKHRLAERGEVLFSPAAPQMEPKLLAEWILADRLPVRFQLQLHKSLWGEERAR